MKILVTALFACANAQNLDYFTVGNNEGLQWTARDFDDCNGQDQRIISSSELVLNQFNNLDPVDALINALTPRNNPQYGHCAVDANNRAPIPVAFEPNGTPSENQVTARQRLENPVTQKYTIDDGVFFRFIPKIFIVDVRDRVNQAINSVREGRNLYNSIVEVLKKIPILKNTNKYRQSSDFIDENARGNMTADSYMDFFHYYCVDYTSQPENTYLQCYLLWEGDIETCARDHSFDVSERRAERCTLQGASDYCRKRGGELAWSEDIEMKMVSGQTGDFDLTANSNDQYDEQDLKDIKQSSNPMVNAINQAATLAKALFSRSDFWPFVRKEPGDDVQQTFPSQKFVTAASLNAVRNDPQFLNLNELGEYTGILPDALTVTSDLTEISKRRYAKYGKWIELKGSHIFPPQVSNSYFMSMNEIPNTSPNNFYTLEGWRASVPTTAQTPVTGYAWSREIQRAFALNHQAGGKMVDGQGNWNAHYMTNFQRGTNTGHSCIDFKINDMGGVNLDSVECDQVNKHPICKMPLQVHLTEPTCPANVIENESQRVCGDNVSRVQAKTTTVGITRENTGPQRTSGWKQGISINAYSDSLTKRFMQQVIYDDTQFGEASGIDDHYGMNIPQFKNTEDFGGCKCDCPVEGPIWVAKNRGNDIIQADDCLVTYCCDEGYQVNLGGQRYDLLNDNRCFHITADDEFSNNVQAPFWFTDNELNNVNGHSNLNTRKVWHDKGPRTSNGKWTNVVTSVDATCVCKEAQCDPMVIGQDWTINRQLKQGENNFSPVTPSTTATYKCPAGQQLVVDDKISVTGQATAECKAYEDGRCGAAWVIPNVRCEQKKTCSVDCIDAPHGRYTVTVDGVTSDVVTADKATTLNPQTQIKIGEKVSFSCDAGFDLYFSGTNVKASEQQCCQECFEPIKRNGETLGGWTNQFAVLDPRVCECRPKQCDPILMADAYELTEQQHGIYVNANDQAKLGTSSIRAGKGVQFSASMMFNAVGYHDWYRASCGKYDIQSPESIRFHERTAMSERMYGMCADPKVCRRVTCEEPPNDLEVCSSLNRVRTTPTNPWERLSRFNFHDTTTEVNDDLTSRNVNYNRARSQFSYPDIWSYWIQGRYANIKNPGTKDNVYPGAQFKATCRKGSKPYLRFVNAVEANNFGPIKGDNSVIYTCNAYGEWESDYECRCENHVDPCHATNPDGSFNFL